MSRRPVAVPHDEEALRTRAAVITLMRAADGARRAMTDALRPFDLTPPQFNVLTILRFDGELPTFQIAARMVEATPGITRLVNTLVDKGLVRRVQATGDRRQQLCSLTVAGGRLLDAAIPPFNRAQSDVLGDLDAGEATQVTALLGRMGVKRVVRARRTA